MAIEPIADQDLATNEGAGTAYPATPVGRESDHGAPQDEDALAANHRDDDVTVVVSRGLLSSGRRRLLWRALMAAGILAAGFFATGIAKRVIAHRRPVLEPSPANSVPGDKGTAQPGVPLAATRFDEPETAGATPGALPVPGAAPPGPSAQKASTEDSVEASKPPAEEQNALAPCKNALAKKDGATVAKTCDQALEADPSLAGPLLAWAKRELDRGNVSVAASWARRVSKVDDRLADAYLVIGVAEQEANHGAAAKAAYKRYLELAPKGRHAAEVRASLAGL